MNITFRDINHRKNELEQTRPNNAPDGIYRLYEKVVYKEYSFNEATQVLRFWRELHEDTNIAFNRVMDIFETATEKDTEEHINFLTDFITEEISNKVRSAKEFQQNVSMKKGKFKSPNRKITTATRTANKNIPNTQEAAKAYEAQHGYHAKPYGGFKKAGEDFVGECYDRIMNAGLKAEQCDRVLSNNENLNKRFNIDKVIRESEDLEDTIATLCEFVNTYDAPFVARYNTALENISYSLQKNGVSFDTKKLIAEVTDYFLMNETITLDGQIFSDMEYILSESKVFTDDDTKSMLAFLNDDVTTSKIQSMTEAVDVYVEGVKPINADEEFRKFKAQPLKDPNIFKSMLCRIYAGHPGDVVDDLTNIFKVIRVLIVTASFVQPVLGIVMLITDYCLKTKYGRAGLKAAIEKYDREIIRVNKKIKNAETEQVKNSYKAYKDKLLTARGTLDTALDKLHTEKENDDRHEKEDLSKIYDDGESDIDFDFDFDFEEAASLIDAIGTICENTAWTNDLTSIVCEKIRKTSRPEDIATIGEFCALCPDLLDIGTIKTTLEDTMDNNLKEKKYSIVPEIAHCVDTLDESYDIVFKDVYEIYENTRYKRDAVVDMIDFCLDSFAEESSTISTSKETKKYQDSFKKNALSSRNKIITTMATLKRDIVKLTDKERMLSKKVDMSLETIRDNINRAFISSNREAVIKGTILPKASTCIKVAITTGAAWAVQPAVAVIGLVGYIGINKAMRNKERQFIIDDIDIELNMCQRYLRHFEDKGDMEAVRNVMKTQRELQRQRNRLVYNMGMVHNTKPDKLPKLDGTEEAMQFVNVENIINEQIANEGAWNDVKRGVNPYSKKKYFHCSFKDLGDETTMKPWIPTYLRETDPKDLNPDYPENATTKRICVSTSIEGCLDAILNYERIKAYAGEKFYIYVPEKPINEYKFKSNDELKKDKDVFDSTITGEAWILEPAKMKLYGIGKIDKVYNVKEKKTVTGKPIGKIEVSWSWAVAPKVIKNWNEAATDIETAAKDAAEKAKDTATDASNYVTNKAKDELSRGIASDKKFANKKLTKDEMIKHPELVKKYIEAEEDDPVLTLNRSVDILMVALDMSTSIQTFIVDKIKFILKTAVNVADPRVKVALKTTRRECEKAIDELTKEIAKETNPTKQRELKNQRKKLQDCLTAVDNKLDDKDAKNYKGGK